MGATGRRNAIIIAILGLVGIIATAVVSNWDKMFPTKGNFETELRHFLKASGTRPFNTTREQLLTQYENVLIAQHPNDWRQIHAALAVAMKQTGDAKFDDWIKLALPIYHKYYTVKELRELNKLYSTKVMRKMAKKNALISAELMAMQGEQFQKIQVIVLSELEKAFSKEKPSQESPTAASH
jgi:hypothetical protein